MRNFKVGDEVVILEKAFGKKSEYYNKRGVIGYILDGIYTVNIPECSCYVYVLSTDIALAKKEESKDEQRIKFLINYTNRIRRRAKNDDRFRDYYIEAMDELEYLEDKVAKEKALNKILDNHSKEIEKKAEELWIAAGKPIGKEKHFWFLAEKAVNGKSVDESKVTESDVSEPKPIDYFNELIDEVNKLKKNRKEEKMANATKSVTVNDAVDIIKKSKGKFLTVSFIKRSNNETRTMNCRTGVSKGVKGTGTKAKDNSLITVYDMVKHEYRNINVSGIRSVKFNGVNYKVV